MNNYQRILYEVDVPEDDEFLAGVIFMATIVLLVISILCFGITVRRWCYFYAHYELIIEKVEKDREEIN